jgi:hypothetical protein
MEMYWSTDYMFGNLFVPNIMPRDRFDKLSEYIHVNDSNKNPQRGEPGHDKLHVRPVIDIVSDTYLPHQNTSVDEAMIALRGRLEFRQYLPAKLTKYGIKVWMREQTLKMVSAMNSKFTLENTMKTEMQKNTDCQHV